MSCCMFCLLRGVRIVVKLSLGNYLVMYLSASIDPDAKLKRLDSIIESIG